MRVIKLSICVVLLTILTSCLQMQHVAVPEMKSESKVTDNEPEITITLAHAAGVGNIMYRSAEMIQDLVAEKSNGEMELKIFSSGQLGDETIILEGIRMGSIDMGLVANASITNTISSLQIFDLPYLIDDREHFDVVFDEIMEDHVSEQFKNYDIEFLGVQDGGFRHISNSVRPVTELNDLSGMTLRILESTVMAQSFQELPNVGATSVSSSELYSALQMGVVDGQDNPLNFVYSSRYYEVQDYLTLTAHFYNPRYYIMNPESFNQLTDSQQDIIVESVKEAMEWHQEQFYIEEKEQLELFEDNGVQIDQPEPSFKKDFRELMESNVYPRFYKEIGNGSYEEGQLLIERIQSLREGN